MPTISQLPAISQVTAADEIPISQGGSASSVSVATLLAGTQPAILVASGNLFGRTSLGPGGPDPVDVGIGLLLNTDTLIATGADHASFPVQTTLTLGDDAVLSSEGNPKLLQLSLLRGLFSPGSNVSIDQYGTISAALTGGTSEYSITNLPTVTTISPGDLVGISQSGSDHTITYANLIDGQTIYQAPMAAAASDTDTLLVAQSGDVMLAQTLSAVWVWINSKLSSYLLPISELTTNTTLNGSLHNGHILICSQAITVSVGATTLGSGFRCELINASAGSITLGSGITTSCGTSSLSPGQAATLTCVTYSGGTIIYGWTSASPSSLAAPVQVDGLAVSSESASTVILTWTAVSPPPAGYTVQYRVSETSEWSIAPSVTVPGCTVTGLFAATTYDFVVSAVNSVGAGAPSEIVSATTSVVLTLPGQVTGVAASNATANSMSLTWSAALAGGEAGSYTVQYCETGAASWSTAITGLTTASYAVSGLIPETSYDFAVFAVNSVGIGPLSSVVTAETSEILSVPGQVIGLTTSNATTSGMSLTWTPPASGGTVSSYTVEYCISGTTSWSTVVSGLISTSYGVTALLPATSYDFEVIASNAAGTGPASNAVVASTVVGNSVTSITWNVAPSGSYTHGNGAIGMNAQILPSSAPVQFGFSTSPTEPPTNWILGSYVNTNLWGAYVNTPSVSGTWYAWVEGIDGSMPTVCPAGFSVT